LTKEKKEKENVLTYLELLNLKNVFKLQFEEFRRKATKAKKKVTNGKEGVLNDFATPASIVGDGTGTHEESKPSWC
jgi:hypothetical protein